MDQSSALPTTMSGELIAALRVVAREWPEGLSRRGEYAHLTIAELEGRDAADRLRALDKPE